MFEILALYMFFLSIWLWFIIKYLLSTISNEKYLNLWLSIFLWLWLWYLITQYIPESLHYNNDVFNVLGYSVWIVLLYWIFKEKEDINKKEYKISDLIFLFINILLYVMYIITLIYYNLVFFEGINAWFVIMTTIINALLLSIFFIFNKNTIKNILYITLISIFVWIIELVIFNYTWINSYFLPSIANIIQSLLWFNLLFYILYILYKYKSEYLNFYMILSYIIFLIIFKIFV